MLNLWTDMIQTSKDCYQELFINIYLNKFKYLLSPLKTVRNSFCSLMSNNVQSHTVKNNFWDTNDHPNPAGSLS